MTRRRATGWTMAIAAGLVAVVASGAAADERQRLLLPDRPDFERPRLGIVGHMRFGEGLVVERVFPGTPAQRLGLERGDVILRINEQRLRREGDAQRALRRADGRVRLLVDDVRGRGVRWTRSVSLFDVRGPSRPYLGRDELARFGRGGISEGF